MNCEKCAIPEWAQTIKPHELALDDSAIAEPGHEIIVPVTEAEFVRLAALGKQYGLTADQMAERLLRDRLG